MLTEQEAIAQLNERLAKKTIKASTRKYIEKLQKLNQILTENQASLTKLKSQMEQIEIDSHKTRGAISILIELAAEEEELLDNQEKSDKSK